jgi:hypothetical protein
MCKFAKEIHMSDSAATEVQTSAPVIAHDPVFINTVHGAVAVYGHEMIAKKDLVILASCLTMEEFGIDEGDHGVRVVVFRDDNRPIDENGPLMAACVPDAGAIVMNLIEIFTKATEEALDDPETAIRACYHRNLILNYLHEIHHMEMLHKTGMPTDDERKDELEEMAEEWALSKLFEMAKSIDIEPAHHAESSFLSSNLMTLLVENDDSWAIDQRYMLENNIMYHLAEKDTTPELTFMSFKGVCHLMSGDAPEDKAWTTDTIVGALPESELANIIKGVDTDAQVEVKLVPATATPNAATESPFVEDDAVSTVVEDAEAVQIPDPGVETVLADPNTQDFGGFGGQEAFEDPAVVASPAMTALAAANPTLPTAPAATGPTNTMFPVAGAPAAVAPPVAPVAAVATQTTPVQATLPQTGLTPEQTRDIVFSAFNKIYSHIFTNCGRLLNSDMAFSNHDAVMTMPIQLDANEQAVITKMDCLDENGRWCPAMATTNGLRGYLSKGKLPFYKLYINNGGFESIRLLMPQNPAKRGGDGQYSKPALQARGGSCIMYVKDVQADKFAFKCIDGAWQAC